MTRIEARSTIASLDDFQRHLTRDVWSELEPILASFRTYTPEAYGVVEDVLTPEGLHILAGVPVPVNGKASPEALWSNPIGSELVSLMREISMSNTYYGFDRNKAVASLRNETGTDLVLPPHRDLLDGHAVLYNYDVDGPIYYIIGGKRVRVPNNALVILNGAADWIEVTEYVDEHPHPDLQRFGGVTEVHSVVGKGSTSRNRLLVYADGRPTLVTQIPA